MDNTERNIIEIITKLEISETDRENIIDLTYGKLEYDEPYIGYNKDILDEMVDMIFDSIIR